MGPVRYLRLDGSTGVRHRQALVDQFNADESISLFLLTTRVGGVGLNLQGADRVVLFDPDWNPSTDAQARERAWRLGQTKPVTVLRLISAGTVEEKVYHRQVWKTVIQRRILIDPSLRAKTSGDDFRGLFRYERPPPMESDEQQQQQ